MCDLVLHVALSQVGKYHSSGPQESQHLAVKGITYAQRALAADAHNFAAQKWTGVLISWSSEFQGYKKKIERSFEIKNHFMVRIVSVCVCVCV